MDRGDVRFICERVGGSSGAERMHAMPTGLGADARLAALFARDVPADGGGIERPVELSLKCLPGI